MKVAEAGCFVFFLSLIKQVSRVQSHQANKGRSDTKKDREQQCVTDVTMAPAPLPRTQTGLIGFFMLLKVLPNTLVRERTQSQSLCGAPFASLCFINQRKG